MHARDGVMMDADRFVLEMAEPEHGGLNATAAAVQFQALLADPCTIWSRRNGKDRIRVELDDHVHLVSIPS